MPDQCYLLFYPNHVLFASFNWVVYKAWQAARYGGDAALPSAYTVFNTFWKPQNIEFWVMLIPLAALAVTLRLSRRRIPRWIPAAKLAELIDRHRGGRILVSSWALRPEPAVVATSPDWQRDAEALRRLLRPMRERLRKLDDNGYQVIWELPIQ